MLRIIPYRFAPSQFTPTAKATIGLREGYLVEVQDNHGNVGYGEAAPLPIIGTETLGQTTETLKHIQSAWGNNFPPSIDEVREWLRPFASCPAASYGVELACLTLLAQQQQIPLVQYLHPDWDSSSRSSIAVNGLIGCVTPTAAAHQAQQLIDRGYRSIKIKLGSDRFDADYDRVSAVRHRVGPGVNLRLDANGAWNQDQALGHLHQLYPLGIEYIEQPVADIAALSFLKSQSPIPIALDESLQQLSQLRMAIARDAAHILILKPMTWGGILPTLEAARLAIHHGWEVVITSTLEGPIGRWGAFHAALALPPVTRACGLYPANRSGDLVLVPQK